MKSRHDRSRFRLFAVGAVTALLAALLPSQLPAAADELLTEGYAFGDGQTWQEGDGWGEGDWEGEEWADPDYPSTWDEAVEHNEANPGADPMGANDWSCGLGLQPTPVVLVHGTFENKYLNWLWMSPALKAAGYCVFALNYGSRDPSELINGTEDIRGSAQELSDFIDDVLASTGASEVDLVGFSQGGMMPRYYIKNLGGADKVGKLIGLAPSNYGTDLHGLAELFELPGVKEFQEEMCKACEQQLEGSDFLTELNAGGDTDPGVEYHVIATKYDEVVTPYTNTFLRDDVSNATNKVVQDDYCALDPVDHIFLPYDPYVIQATLHYLGTAFVPEPALCL